MAKVIAFGDSRSRLLIVGFNVAVLAQGRRALGQHWLRVGARVGRLILDLGSDWVLHLFLAGSIGH